MSSLLDPIKCAKCGNDDQDTLLAISDPPINPSRRERQRVTLKGWRCSKCGHVTPDRS